MRYQAALRPVTDDCIPAGRWIGSVMVRAAWSGSAPAAAAVGRRSAATAATRRSVERSAASGDGPGEVVPVMEDRKSTRLNSSHLVISYAVFCLKKKKGRDLREGRHADR